MSRRFCETWELRNRRRSKLPGLATAARPGHPSFIVWISPPKSELTWVPHVSPILRDMGTTASSALENSQVSQLPRDPGAPQVYRLDIPSKSELTWVPHVSPI